MELKRVVVTGIGLVTPAGSTVHELLESIYGGKSGIRRIRHFDASHCRTQIAATVEGFDPGGLLTDKEIGRLDRATQMGLVAAQSALSNAGLLTNGRVSQGDSIGVVIGTGAGNIQTIERHFRDTGPEKADTLCIPNGMNHASAAYLSMRFGLRGFPLTVSTACSSGATAIGIALREIQCGAIRGALAGGVDAPITPDQLDLWGSLRTLSSWNGDADRAVKPFSRNRDGFVLGEGAMLLVLEELSSALARGGKIYGEVLGFGSSSDASHITRPCAEGQALAMVRALESARVLPQQVSYINAHGTATRFNDRTETDAIKCVFGHCNPPPISSIKPITGHMIGASGAAELAVALLACGRRLIPPTCNYEEEDPDCDLDYVVEGPREADLDIVMSNSFAFGGHNAVLVAKGQNGGLDATEN